MCKRLIEILVGKPNRRFKHGFEKSMKINDLKRFDAEERDCLGRNVCTGDTG